MDAIQWAEAVYQADLQREYGEATDLESRISRRELRRNIFKVMMTLSPRERQIVRLRTHEWTYKRIGECFSVGPARVRQIEAKALRKLRHPSRAKFMRDFVTPEPAYKPLFVATCFGCERTSSAGSLEFQDWKWRKFFYKSGWLCPECLTKSEEVLDAETERETRERLAEEERIRKHNAKLAAMNIEKDPPTTFQALFEKCGEKFPFYVRRHDWWPGHWVKVEGSMTNFAWVGHYSNGASFFSRMPADRPHWFLAREEWVKHR